jgi:superfamily II DNA or RNA helicase
MESVALEQHRTIQASELPLERTHEEAYRELCAMAEGRVGAVPAASVARHVLAITAGGDWPVQRAAMDAVIRRWAFAKRDELRVASRPGRQSRLGRYATRRRGSTARPYTTELYSLEPLCASCDCPDFIRSALGICKHVLTVLEDLRQSRRGGGRTRSGPALSRAEGGSLTSAPAESGSLISACPKGASFPLPLLAWSPVRPLTGAGDWMARIRWTGAQATLGGISVLPRRARSWLAARENGSAALTGAQADSPERRLAIIEDLLEWARQQGNAKRVSPCDPALRSLLELEQSKLRQVAALGLSEAALQHHLSTLSRKLYPYQIEAVRRFLRTGRLLLADDMGLGKTIEAVATCHVLWRSHRASRGLIVVPASLKSQWLREWRAFSSAPLELVEGSPAQREAMYRGTRKGFLVTNYEQILRDLPVIRRFAPDIVVLDEAQRIKNWETKTAAYVKQLDPAFRLVLTGTPMENRLDELASILEWVDPLALEPVWRLGPWHSTLIDGRNEVGGARNLDTLRARLEPCMLRRVRREVLEQLPARTDTRVPVELTPVQREEHDALHQPIASLLRRARKRPLIREEFLRLMQLLTTQRIICNGLALYQFTDVWPGLADVTRPTDALIASLASPKLRELRELIAALAVEQRLKIVVFSQWRRMLRLAHWSVQDLLARGGLRAVFFTGEESQKRRTQNIIDFHDDPRARVLFSTDAGGVGLNLQRAASCCINIELPWNPAVLEQRIGRIYRLGQKKPIEVYNLVCDEGIESRIFDLVGNKRALFTGLFDGTSDEVSFERSGTFLNRIEKLVEPAQTLRVVEEREDVDEGGTKQPDLDDALLPQAQGTVAVAGALSALPVEKAPQAALPVAASTQVADLVSRLRIERSADGGISIRAPADAAQALAEVFSGMAQLLVRASAPSGDDSRPQDRLL